MGLLITLYLITCNVYGSTNAPINRGFSYIEVWILGIQICILMAIFEYSLILALQRLNSSCEKEDGLIKSIDLISFIITITFFTLFNIIYWNKCCIRQYNI